MLGHLTELLGRADAHNAVVRWVAMLAPPLSRSTPGNMIFKECFSELDVKKSHDAQSSQLGPCFHEIELLWQLVDSLSTTVQ